MQIHIKAQNAKLTPQAHDLINEKIGSLTKYYDNIINANVEVGLTSMHHQKGDIFKAEVNLQVPGKVLRATAETDNMPKSINQVRDILKRDLVKYKEMR